MNWLYVGLPLMGIYLIWFAYLLLKRQYTRPLLFFALAHLPYLLVNVVAPFRGAIDPEYAGYSLGLIQLPAGPLVPLVVGGIVISSLFLASKALLNRMEGLWTFAFVFDLLLVITVAAPLLIGVLSNLSASRIELGEYLQISGFGVSLLILAIFTVPTIYACYLAGRQLFDHRRSQLAE